MYKGLLSRLKIAFRNGVGGRLWFQRLMSLISICFVVFSPNHSKAIPLTKEHTVNLFSNPYHEQATAQEFFVILR